MTRSSTGPQIESINLSFQRWRERFLQMILNGAAIFGLIALIAVFLLPPDFALLSVFIAAYVILLAITFIRMPYRLRAYSFLLIIYAVALNDMIHLGIGTGAARLFLLSLIVLSGFLISSRAAITALAVSLITIVVVGWLTLSGHTQAAETESLGTWLASSATFILLSIIITLGVNLFQVEFYNAQQRSDEILHNLEKERAHLESRVQQRTQELELKTNQLRSSTSVARTVAEIQDILELSNSVAQLTAEHYGYYHVGLFLFDDRKRFAFLQSASSQTGKDLIARGYRVDLEKRNAINSVLEQNKPCIVSDTTAGTLLKDADFPLTRSRMVLPLRVRGSMLGVIDLHSEQVQAFGQEEAEILQTLADLVAVSIDNVRLLNETKALVNQLETFTAYQSREAWQVYTSHRALAYQYTPAGVRPSFPSASNMISSDGLRVPLSLRGQTIGAITLRRKEGAAAWTERERALIGEIADQAALALDNSRLVEEAQRNAQRDQLIANISSRVRETLDVDTVVRTAAYELRRIFDLKEAEVSIGALKPGNPQADNASGRGTQSH
ncbi:MAG: GAF domain-containing protein [Chloroflexi bacterium]|nr:GAF domain-containing protein [Chloroflexota bacterium]